MTAALVLAGAALLVVGFAAGRLGTELKESKDAVAAIEARLRR